jgi:hypothetical protein
MPSGFQQDQNQLTPSYYRVVITMDGGNATWYTVDTNDGDETAGRVSPYAWDNFPSDLPSTQGFADALARGNLRFQAIIEEVSKYADCQILDVETLADAESDLQADNNQLAFTVKYDRDEFVFPGYNAWQKTQSLGDDGTGTSNIPNDGTIYTWYSNAVDNNYVYNTTDAIRDLVYRALDATRTRSVRNINVIDETGVQQTLTVQRPWDDNVNAFADITVQEIDGTSTTVTLDQNAE